MRRGPAGENTCADNFQDEVAYVKEWLAERIAWMDSQLDFDPNASMRGDVDGNGKVNINDVTALINYLLGQVSAGVDQDAADCDLDGGVNISDVTKLINFLLLGHWEAS